MSLSLLPPGAPLSGGPQLLSPELDPGSGWPSSQSRAGPPTLLGLTLRPCAASCSDLGA